MTRIAAILIGFGIIMNTADAQDGWPAPAEPFGKTADGTPVELYTLKNKNGMVVKIMTRGATITEIHVPDKNGKIADVALGFDTVQGYESDDNQYFGTATGRYANRIAKGKFKLDGKEYTLAVNNGPNHLHGGVKRSLDKVVWKGQRLRTQIGSEFSPGVRFTYRSPDGEEGYPGTLTTEISYSLSPKNELIIQYIARTDKPTIINLTNHSYFNLSGHGSPTVLDHELTLAAEKYTPTDDTLIPTGAIEPVAGTAFDFLKPHRIGERIDPLIKTANLGYDHSFVLPNRGETPTFAAKLKDPKSGRVMEVHTTQPGVQVYTGNFLKNQKGKGGATYAQRSAICLETHHWPDSINQKGFPNVVLRPGETYRQTCIYAFSAE